MSLGLPSFIMLETDDYSPMSFPHNLAALHWKGLLSSFLLDENGKGGDQVDKIEEGLQEIGWQPAWRFGMFKQAHYHTTTHELLIVISGSATIRLGGTDERSKPLPPPSDSLTQQDLTITIGDTLLVPAGYTHRSLQDQNDFQMIGSYPRNASKWDMRFPNVMGCSFDVDAIQKLVSSVPRKGLGPAQCPSHLLHRPTQGNPTPLDSAWGIST